MNGARHLQSDSREHRARRSWPDVWAPMNALRAPPRLHLCGGFVRYRSPFVDTCVWASLLTLASFVQVVHGSNFGDLYEEDAGVVVENSGDFAERNMRINDTTERLARWLDTREEVDTVYYPSLEKDNKKLYDEFLTPKGGYGSLLSVVS